MVITRRNRIYLIGPLALVAFQLLVTSSAVATPPQISAGFTSTCTIATNGSLKCWGNNSFGQLGIGNFVGFPNPKPVAFFRSVSALSVGNGFACAISSGALFCWGKNDFGQLGNGTTTGATTPFPVTGLSSGVTAVAAGGSHTCAIQNQELKCWGNNSRGQLGRGPHTGVGGFQTTPQQVWVPVFFTTEMISAGNAHTCATAIVDGVRGLYCWGDNFFGQAGQPGTSNDFPQPMLVRNPTNFVPFGVAAGSTHACGLYRNGAESRVVCWGNNQFGQLGLGHRKPCTFCFRSISAAIGNTASVVTGPMSLHTCSLSNNGKVHCWGRNSAGQIGDNSTTDRLNPTVPLQMGSNVMQISIGGGHTCSWVKSAGVISTPALGVLDDTVALDLHPFCWGANANGQLGVRDFAVHQSPTRVFGL
jgi:alpha-tubulin suppressor-like RCC1 family protein